MKTTQNEYGWVLGSRAGLTERHVQFRPEADELDICPYLLVVLLIQRWHAQSQEVGGICWGGLRLCHKCNDGSQLLQLRKTVSAYLLQRLSLIRWCFFMPLQSSISVQ